MTAKNRLGDFFAKRNEEGNTGLPTWSVTINNGLIARDTLERKMDTNLSASDHLLIRKGDLAYNMMRMWQGASGLASQDGLVSPAYVVLAPKDNIDPLFASYWFKSPRMIYLFWAYSYGITKDRLRLYYKDFARIPATPPPLEKQKRIAALLLSWDEAIEKISRLIDVKQKLTRGLMQQLLTGKRRFPGHKKKWKSHEFGQIATPSKGRHNPKVSNAVFPCVELEHIGQQNGRLLGTIESSHQSSVKARFKPGDVLFGKLRPNLQKYFLCSFEGVCSTEIWVLRPKPVCKSEYLFWLVQSNRFTQAACTTMGSKMPRADWGWVSEQVFPLPPLEEQTRIASCLSVIHHEIALLTQQHEALQEQKKGLMQQLLTGKVLVPVKSKEVARA